jgi:RNA polymerase sigma-70 factor (ECF subfamily)
MQKLIELSLVSPTLQSTQDIAEGLRQGSSEAFGVLYETYGQPVVAYLTRMTGRKETAEELTQETFLIAIRKISFFRSGADGGLKAWIFRIATNLAIDALRREKLIKPFSDDGSENNTADLRPTADQELEHFEFTQSLNSALLELTPAQRTIFLLKEQEEMSLLEISRVCGCAENAVKQSLFRARAALRKKLCK